MSSLLLNEPPLIVLRQLACEIGLNEAMVAQQLHFLQQNPKLGKVVDGRHWIRMKLEEWKDVHFPFWSESTIQRTLESLIESGLVLATDTLNELSFDRTKWYAIDEHVLDAIESRIANRKLDDSNLQNGACQNGPTIPKNLSLSSKSDDEIFDDSVPAQAPRRTAEQAKASLRETLSKPELGKGAAKSNPHAEKTLFVEQAVVLMYSLCSQSGLNDKTKPMYVRYAQQFLDDPPLWANNTRVTPDQILLYLARQVRDKADYQRPQFVPVTVAQELAKLKPDDLIDAAPEIPKASNNTPDLSFMDTLAS